ncbi:MAG: OB-fold nucleic acid binding domain-containing protein, partial [Planctomycetota bacterium]|nr:OB-fold nucleic acid binding domain-containing protein [Planctomycetota bacterium]
AYLKAHYSVEFMAALLSGDIPNRNFTRKDALVEHIEDCVRMNIEVVAPCVNQSDVDFSVGDGKIFFGLSAIKGCGGNAAVALVRERTANGPYRDLFDLCERVESSSCNRSTLETLIKAGAMDTFELNRSQLLAILDRAIQAGASALADKLSGQQNLFGDFGNPSEETEEPLDLPDLPEMPDREKSLAEKEVLGFYLTSHPLAEHKNSLEMHCSHESSMLRNLKDRSEIILGGIASSLKYSNVKRVREPGGSTRYVMFDLEDLEGSVRCICWPSEFEKIGHLIQPDSVLIVEGNVDKRGGDEPNLIVRDVIPIQQIQQRNTTGLSIRISEKDHDDQVFTKILEILRGYPGGKEIMFTIALNDGKMVQVKSNRSGVEIQPELRDRLDDLLGKGNIKPIFAKTKRMMAQRR